MKGKTILLLAAFGLLFGITGCRVHPVLVSPNIGTYDSAKQGDYLEFSPLNPADGDFWVVFSGLSPCKEQSLLISGGKSQKCKIIRNPDVYYYFLSATPPPPPPPLPPPGGPKPLDSPQKPIPCKYCPQVVVVSKSVSNNKHIIQVVAPPAPTTRGPNKTLIPISCNGTLNVPSDEPLSNTTPIVWGVPGTSTDLTITFTKTSPCMEGKPYYKQYDTCTLNGTVGTAYAYTITSTDKSCGSPSQPPAPTITIVVPQQDSSQQR
jgi:hypothetical protein